MTTDPRQTEEGIAEIQSTLTAFARSKARDLRRLDIEPEDFIQETWIKIWTRNKTFENWGNVAEGKSAISLKSMIWIISERAMKDRARFIKADCRCYSDNTPMLPMPSLDKPMDDSDNGSSTIKDTLSYSYLSMSIMVELFSKCPDTPVGHNLPEELTWRKLMRSLIRWEPHEISAALKKKYPSIKFEDILTVVQMLRRKFDFNRFDPVGYNLPRQLTWDKLDRALKKYSTDEIYSILKEDFPSVSMGNLKAAIEELRFHLVA